MSSWELAERARRELDERVRHYVGRGWRVDATSEGRVQLSRPSYWLAPWATVLLGLVTCFVWFAIAAVLQGSGRRDELLLTVGPHFGVIEQRTRGW